MSKIKKISVTNGIFWIEIPEADLRILCGAPEDSVKHLMKRGLIVWTEANGAKFETGPNAILLSDTLIQHGHISNLAEFPVLQMLYRQGMIIPNHPNNKGTKPILIGTKEQVDAQFDYILRGNYGLLTEEEIIEAGLTPEDAKDLMRQKLKFAFGKFQESNAFLNKCYVNRKGVEVSNSVFVKHIGINKYEIVYEDESVKVDLNLDAAESYESPYYLSYFNTNKEYFAVIQSGQGDGWNLEQPTMSSLVMYQGKTYLIDAGPNVEKVLESLGVGINELDGIFHTHGHDDHFCGILTLLRSDKKLKYFSTKLVRHSVTKKLSALLSIPEDDFEKYFDVVDLEEGEWNNIDGLEVKAIFSPHPVETNIFQFRARWKDGFKTYGHYADLTSFTVLDNMTTQEKEGLGISQEFAEKTKKAYLESMNLKKLDAGGGMIHGEAVDFKDDKSKKIILSHTSGNLNNVQKTIGSTAPFGSVDILIENTFNYRTKLASDLLINMFPELHQHDLMMFLNLGFNTYNPGTIILKEGEKTSSIKLVISGIAEVIFKENEPVRRLTNGTIIGGLSALIDSEATETIRAVSYVTTLDIESKMFVDVVNKNGYFHKIENQKKYIEFFQSSTLFKEEISHHSYNTIINATKRFVFKEGATIDTKNSKYLHIIRKGSIEVRMDGITISYLNAGDYICYESSVLEKEPLFELVAKDEIHTVSIKGDILKDIPILRWNIYEHYEINRKVYLTMKEF